KRSERIEIHGLSTPRGQVGVQKGGVAHLVVGVVGDVLGHVAVEVLKRGHVGSVASVDSAKLVVLLPEIGLEYLGGGEESKDRSVPLRELAGCCPCGGLDSVRQQCAGGQHRSGDA